MLENLITVSFNKIFMINFSSLSLSVFFFFQILDSLNPGQAMPLPLHLAEAGCVRWRPSGNSYLWSETCNLSNLLAQESKLGSFRSFVSYPSRPSSDPFRCCMSTRNIILPSHQKPGKVGNDLMLSAVEADSKLHSSAGSQERCIHHLTLSTPLAVRSFLPEEAKLIVDTGGMIHSAIVSEVCEIYSYFIVSLNVELQGLLYLFIGNVSNGLYSLHLGPLPFENFNFTLIY